MERLVDIFISVCIYIPIYIVLGFSLSYFPQEIISQGGVPTDGKTYVSYGKSHTYVSYGKRKNPPNFEKKE
jgi:hypothetical protein